MPPKSSSLLSTVANKLKPHKAEAIQRIRFNVLVITSVVILSYLLPIPSAFSAVTIPFRDIDQEAWTIEWFWQWFAVAEFALLALCFYNVLEAGYALKYPRTPLSPITSPAKAKRQSSSLTTPKRPFKVLSPNSSPQPQKPFAFSPTASTSFSSASLNLSSSSIPYAQSPISTPSRVIHYSPVPSSLTNTMTSSTSDYLQSPSPVISAYRGKHTSTDLGRALDGSYLSRMKPSDSFEE
ncbi:hypothetical protein BDN70DRAFT_883917 [Pholiota conissans]|uniref:Uncharacterized protein n=1 Tax=Pholiota conissans TaxID=109636 RepID=A0A9P6CWJ0_9AGAR|nr:hypothetical protein BDN70DRAFT_883917 [Pholiota conissans]